MFAETETEKSRPEIEGFREFAILTRQKRELMQRVKDIDAKLDVLDYMLRDYLAEQKLGHIHLQDLSMTVYLRKQIYARHKEWATAGQVCEALKQNGMRQFVKEQYNSNSLSAHIRQLEDRYSEELKAGKIKSIAEKLPFAVAEVLSIEPTYSVVAMETT